MSRFSLSIVLALALSGCGSGDERDVCAAASSNSAFVFVESPVSGGKVASGFRVTGCSNTFEGTINWRLHDRTGHQLASGYAQGGSREPEPFSFAVDYHVDSRQIGQLEVYEPRVTREGFPPVRNLIPVLLEE